jgi:hypothetical protein
VSGPSYAFEYAVVGENQDAVIVGIVESAMPGTKRRVGIQRTAKVILARPLGGRNVVDARTGGTLPVAPDEMSAYRRTAASFAGIRDHAPTDRLEVPERRCRRVAGAIAILDPQVAPLRAVLLKPVRFRMDP